jgi:hypothetical protein
MSAGPTLPRIDESQITSDLKSSAEAQILSSGNDLKQAQNQRAVDDERRKNGIQSHLNIITIGSFWLLALSAGTMLLTLIYHFIMPVSKQYLTADQLNNLKQMLFSGGVGAAISQLSKKHLS